MVSGLIPETNRPIQTRFRCGCVPCFHMILNLASDNQLAGSLNKRHAVTPSRKTSLRDMVLRLIVSIQFQVLFALLPECFSPFPRGTGSLSVTGFYLALPRGRGGFLQDYTCPVVLGAATQKDCLLSPTGLSPPLARLFQDDSDRKQFCNFPKSFRRFPAEPRYTAWTTA